MQGNTDIGRLHTMERHQGSRAFFLGLVLTALTISVAVYPIVRNHILCIDRQADYRTHIEVAVEMVVEGRIVAPHFLFHALTAVGILLGLSPRYSAGGVAMSAHVALPILLYMFFYIGMGRMRAYTRAGVASVAALGVAVATPITLLTLADHNLYLGYVGLATYHSPTMTLLRPLALGLFVLLQLPSDSRFHGWPRILLIAGLAVLSTLAKPSYTICLIPALVICTVCRFRTEKQLRYVAAFLLPASLVLLFQYLFRFAGTPDAGMVVPKIVIAPLAVQSYYSDQLLLKAGLSMLFPLYILVAYGRHAIRDRALLCGWCAFAFGMVYAYMLAEASPTGVRVDGNFVWSAQITLFVLFVFSVRFLFIRNGRTAREGRDGAWSAVRFWVGAGLLSCHVLSGLVFFVVNLLGQGRYWW